MPPKTATPNSPELRQEIPITHGKTPARWVKKHPPLEMVTRSHVDTNSAAYYLNRQPQTLRGWHSHGRFPSDDLRPLVLNGRLAWSVAAIKAALGYREMITDIQTLKKKLNLKKLLTVLMANQNKSMSTLDLLQCGIVKPAAGIARLKKLRLIIERSYQFIVDSSGKTRKRLASYRMYGGFPV